MGGDSCLPWQVNKICWHSLIMKMIIIKPQQNNSMSELTQVLDLDLCLDLGEYLIGGGHETLHTASSNLYAKPATIQSTIISIATASTKHIFNIIINDTISLHIITFQT